MVIMAIKPAFKPTPINYFGFHYGQRYYLLKNKNEIHLGIKNIKQD